MRITDKEIPVDKICSVFSGVFRRPVSGQNGRKFEALVFVSAGQAEYDFGHKKLAVQPGDVFYLPKDSTYSIRVTQYDYRFICVDFLFQGQSGEPDRWRMGKSAEHGFVKMQSLWKLGSCADGLLCKAAFYELYANLTKAAAVECLAQGQQEKMGQVVEYIAQNYADPELSVEALAERYGTSGVHFRRTFGRIYGTSPVKYIAALRLNKARQLLMDTDLPVGEICQRCGYSSVYYFDRVFKKAFGMQPTQFREMTF